MYNQKTECKLAFLKMKIELDYYEKDCLSVCLYVSLQHPQFQTNQHKTWHGHSRDPGSDMGQVRLPFAAHALRYGQSLYRVKGVNFFSFSFFFFFFFFFLHFYEFKSISSQLRYIFFFFSKFFQRKMRARCDIKAQNARERKTKNATAKRKAHGGEVIQNASAKHDAQRSEATYQNAEHEGAKRLSSPAGLA